MGCSRPRSRRRWVRWALLDYRGLRYHVALIGGGALLLDAGLPDGFLGRVVRRDFAGLATSVASRYDQIHFKLYAAVDQGPDSKHAQDLLRLAPEPGELDAAAVWCRRQDPSSAFAGQLRQALEYLDRRLRDADG